jgi:hypothetical protein
VDSFLREKLKCSLSHPCPFTHPPYDKDMSHLITSFGVSVTYNWGANAFSALKQIV